MVGIPVSPWDGLFSGAFAVSFREGTPTARTSESVDPSTALHVGDPAPAAFDDGTAGDFRSERGAAGDDLVLRQKNEDFHGNLKGTPQGHPAQRNKALIRPY